MKRKVISILIVIALMSSLFTFATATAASNPGEYEALRFDPNSAPDATLTTDGVTYNVYRVTYCLDPITILDPGAFMLTMRVPVSYNGKTFTAEELAKAPIFFTNPWGGDRGASAPAATAEAESFALAALQKGFVTVNVGMRGILDVVDDYSYGRAPNPLADLKASLRYLHFNDDVMPGNAERIIARGWSSGGVASVMLGSTGNTNFFDTELKAIGAYMGPGARDDIWLAAPGVAVMMRPNGEPATAYELFGDLTDAVVGTDTNELNKFLSTAYVNYLEKDMKLIATYDVPEAGISVGDPLTAANYRDYLLPQIGRSLLYYLNVFGLNEAGDKSAIEEYMAGTREGSGITSRNDVFDLKWDGNRLIGVEATNWNDYFQLNSPWALMADPQKGAPPNPMFDWVKRYDAPAFNESVLDLNGVGISGTPSVSQDSWGRPEITGLGWSIFSPTGIEWAEKYKEVKMSQDLKNLLARQGTAYDPMWFLLQVEKGNTSIGDISIAPYWFHRAGSYDPVNVIPNFFALDTKLKNMGYNVDSMLTWDNPHQDIADVPGLWRYIDWALSDADGATKDIPFTDVAPNAWYYDAVKYAYSQDLMIGENDTKFSPDTTLTRAMTVTILHRLAGEPEFPADAPSFNDVVTGAWYYKAVMWAASEEIVNGYGDGRFGPNNPVTKEQLAALIYRTQQATGKIPNDILMDYEHPDWNAISDFAKSAVTALTMQGVFRDIPGVYFNPLAPATRAEVASMLYRWLTAD